ncbi:ALF repeat-containing protein [Corynebacterium bovis]|uniref:Methyl-accepting transducer domain-containing protein n=2 Tax=Corynebacterium bovis TaxID=36808 RepID=A0A3R8QEE9_9CORY|nr:ALF repeat-containing protein [Corynebacterium bovis]MDN8578874.1 ALF repeat-containing protein [Corynebacterium bovis]RRO86725.1 hypothetical protein CXF48_05465 [Corynebacterium bovis]
MSAFRRHPGPSLVRRPGPHLRHRLGPYLVRVIAVVVLLAVGTGVSGAEPMARADRAAATARSAEQADARAVAAQLLSSPFPASRAAAEQALSGDDRALAEYAAGGMETARRQDLRDILVALSTVSGPTVQREAGQLIADGSVEQIGDFLGDGWKRAQADDDRATAWEAAGSPDGSSVKRAADAVLRSPEPDALAQFAAEGLDRAQRADQRREVYELTESPLPTVAANAQQAVRIGTDEAIESFLRYGQFVAAAQDAERMQVSDLVTMAVDEAARANEATSLALQQADRAARAAENAREATDRARDEARQAGDAQVRAENAANAAGTLANRSAEVADQAVAAAQDARRALQQTADAMSRAASAAARARAAAGAASARASAAARDASVARDARIAAEQARDAAKAARDSAAAFDFAATSAGHADNAARAAGSAAANADAAAAAAGEAAQAAGVSEGAAAEARAGAARARAAAGEVDRIVGRIRSLVDEVRRAATEAAEHASRSADAADAAVREAGNADYAARMAGRHADDAAAAAEASRKNIDLAERVGEVAGAVARDRLDAEGAFLRDRALAARAAQDARDAAAEETARRRGDLAARMAVLDGAGATADPGSAEVRGAVVAAAQVGGPAVAGAARVALEGGTADDLRGFVRVSYPEAVAADNATRVRNLWATDPDDAVRAAADRMADAGPDEVAEFLATTVPELRLPGLRARAWALREGAGPAVTRAADDALRTNTAPALEGFVTGGGFERARQVDQIREAYALADSGGPEVKAAAQAAVVGDRAMLNDFIVVGQYVRQGLDDQRAAHDAQIAGMLQSGRRVADSASAMAADARAAHYRAVGSAARAAEFAAEARGWSGQAQAAAQAARESVGRAEQSLRFAEAQQTRAWQAARAAQQDAEQATTNAARATSFATDASAAAAEAAASARDARASAVAAGEDAQRASDAAAEAYASAVELQEREQAEIQDNLVAQGEDPAPASFLDVLKETVGQQALDLLLDIIGVNDLLDCAKGELSGCLLTLLNFAGPIVKAGFKVARNFSTIRWIISKVDDVAAAWKTRKAARVKKAEAVFDAPACAMRPARFSGPARMLTAGYRWAAAGAGVVRQVAASCPAPYPKPKRASYYRVNINELTPDELNVFQRWDKSQELSKEAIDRFPGGHELPGEIGDIVESLKAKITKHDIEIKAPHRLNQGIDPSKPTRDLGLVGKSNKQRTIAQDPYQNVMAVAEIQFAKFKEARFARLNQRDISMVRKLANKTYERVARSRGRPDVATASKEGDVNVKIEFDTKSSNRGIGHAEQLLDADPNAKVFLVELTSGKDGSLLSKELREVLDANAPAFAALKQSKKVD